MLTESGVFIYLSTLEGYHAIYTRYIGRMHYKIIYKASRLEEPLKARMMFIKGKF